MCLVEYQIRGISSDWTDPIVLVKFDQTEKESAFEQSRA